MSSIRQELAAILMDHTRDIPEQTYIDILNKLAAIPDHEDPKSAKELQIELEKERDQRENAEQLNDLLAEQLAEADDHINETHKVLFAIMGRNGPVYEDEHTVMYAKRPTNEVPHWWKSHLLEARIRNISMETPSIYTDYIDLHLESEETDEERTSDMANYTEELEVDSPDITLDWCKEDWEEQTIYKPRDHTATTSSFREHVYQSCELHNNGRGAYDLDWWAYSAKYEDRDYDSIVQDRRYRWVPRHLKIEFRYQNYKNSLILNNQIPSIDNYHHIKCPQLTPTIILPNAQH